MFIIDAVTSMIFIGCHAILAVTNKNIYDYILRSAVNHKLESSDMLAKDSEVGQSSQHETKNEMKSGTWRWT